MPRITKSTQAIGKHLPFATTSHEENKMRIRIPQFLLALVACMLFSVATANASYQRFLPGGLPTNSTQAATTAVLDYADLNQGYGKIIANQTGSKAFNKNDYVAAGWGTAPADTKNSALSGTGSAVAYNDASSVGVKTIRIRNTKTGLLVNVMVRCGNPRVKSGVRVVKKVKIRKILRIYVNKKFTVTKTITCPSGQQVTGTVTGYVRGWFRTKVHGWTTGAKLYYSQQVDLRVTNTLKLKCGPAPTPTPPLTSCNASSMSNTNTGNACQGNSSSQDSKEDAKVNNDCKGPNYNSSQCQTTIIQITNQTTIQVNANCSKVTIVYNDGHQEVQFKDNNGNVVTENYCSSQTTTPTCTGSSCNTTPPPPPGCTSNCTPPPPVDHAPQISCVYPAHVYQGGNVYVWCEASDSDGDALSVNIVGNSYAHVSGTIPVNVRWDNTPCPSGTSCYRATLWGDNVGTAHVTATVTANGKSATSVGDFPVKQDEF